MSNRAGYCEDFLEALFQCLTATYFNQKKKKKGSTAKVFTKNAKFKAMRANNEQWGGLQDSATLKKSDTFMCFGLLNSQMGIMILLHLSRDLWAIWDHNSTLSTAHRHQCTAACPYRCSWSPAGQRGGGAAGSTAWGRWRSWGSLAGRQCAGGCFLGSPWFPGRIRPSEDARQFQADRWSLPGEEESAGKRENADL